MSSITTSSFIRHCRQIVGVGRNFAEHAKELNNPIPKSPLLFLKSTSSLLPYSANKQSPSVIRIPPGCTNLHHEVELGVYIGKRASHVTVEEASKHIGGYFLCLDMTARELQEQAKKKGEPWSTAKGYDTFCPISSFIPLQQIDNPMNVELWCKVNNVERQRGNTKDMLFNISQLISHISTIFALEEGTLILTGTPSGVGPVKHGDILTAGISHLSQYDITFKVENAPNSKL